MGVSVVERSNLKFAIGTIVPWGEGQRFHKRTFGYARRGHEAQTGPSHRVGGFFLSLAARWMERSYPEI